MKSDSISPVLAGVRQRRQLLVDEWSAAIHRVCGYGASDRDLQDRLHSLLDEILAGLVDDASLKAVARRTGGQLAQISCTCAEVLGQTHLILFHHFLTGLAPQDREALQPVLAAFLGEMASSFFAGPDMSVVVMRDRLEEARRAERRYYTTILDMVDALIVVVDAGGHIVGFNGAAERVSGYTFDDVYGQHIAFLQAPDLREKTATLVTRLQSLPRERRSFLPHESVWFTRRGERREIEWSTTAVTDEDGEVSFIIGTGTDVTASRRMERELAEAHRQVAQIKEAERLRLAQDLHDDAVQQLLGISYQLVEMQRRASESGVWTPAQRLEELTPGLEVVRGDIIAVAQGLRRLISSLRPPALREMGLAEILDVYISDWQQGIGQNGPLVQLDISTLEGKHLPEPVATCIFRVVQEGIWNAHKHAAARSVNVSIVHTGDQVLLHIKDDGVGFRIPSHLFQFAAAGRFGFLGMQERVHAVNGLLSVWSEPGQGADIQVNIPLGRGE